MGLPLKIQSITPSNSGATKFLIPSYQSEEYLQQLNSQYNHLTRKLHGVNRRDFIALALEEFSNQYVKQFLRDHSSAEIVVYGTHNENLFLGMKYEVDILPSNLEGRSIRMGYDSEVSHPEVLGIASDFYLEKLLRNN